MFNDSIGGGDRGFRCGDMGAGKVGVRAGGWLRGRGSACTRMRACVSVCAFVKAHAHEGVRTRVCARVCTCVRVTEAVGVYEMQPASVHDV